LHQHVPGWVNPKPIPFIHLGPICHGTKESSIITDL
jgi:hypothetical protein